MNFKYSALDLCPFCSKCEMEHSSVFFFIFSTDLAEIDRQKGTAS